MLNPLISVVSGTYNRLESLIRMVSSARVAIPASLGYEIIIVDGGSDDGTLQWCKRQPDIHLIDTHAIRTRRIKRRLNRLPGVRFNPITI